MSSAGPSLSHPRRSAAGAEAGAASDRGIFSSDRHAGLLLAQMNKMRQQSDFCDVRLLVGGRVFGVHKLVLAASGPYFAALFSGAMSEAHEEEVRIVGVEADVFEILLEFIYTGSIDVTVDTVQELMVAADMLQLSEVVDICGEFLRAHMDPSNCVGIYRFLEQIACMELLQFTEDYIHVHFLEVCASEEFSSLSKDQLVKLLRSEELRIEDEYQVFTAAMDWLHHDVPHRKKHVVEVLEPVRFPLLSPQRLYKYIEGERDAVFHFSAPHRSRLIGEKDSMIFDCTERYDPVTKQWAAVASLNYPRCGVGVYSCHGALYALGGWIGSEIGKTMERYDPEENKWEVIGSMAVPRYYFGCCELQGFIYVIGGISDEGTELRSAEVYDPISRRWSALPVMVTRRAYVGVASLNNCIYAVGGWNEALGSLDTVEKYCLEEEKWVEVASMAVPRAGVTVAAVNGLLYAVGGRTSSRDFSAPVTVDSVEIYDPHLDTWTEIGNMITSRCDGGVAVL
ncbi:actin-binding protein IPP [Sinocyclocheilus grahami]|uniref:actin-binding protein IPP n=1 Tax=Sinocyclocheilus grahami TaxID=75366 RepID=UPI0007ACF624|nr:PREDICTED: actin-binding protein IPP [Sinocyclocheilus grahami]